MTAPDSAKKHGSAVQPCPKLTEIEVEGPGYFVNYDGSLMNAAAAVHIPFDMVVEQARAWVAEDPNKRKMDAEAFRTAAQKIAKAQTTPEGDPVRGLTASEIQANRDKYGPHQEPTTLHEMMSSPDRLTVYVVADSDHASAKDKNEMGSRNMHPPRLSGKQHMGGSSMSAILSEGTDAERQSLESFLDALAQPGGAMEPGEP